MRRGARQCRWSRVPFRKRKIRLRGEDSRDETEKHVLRRKKVLRARGKIRRLEACAIKRLLLEEVVERLAGVERARGSSGLGDGRLLCGLRIGGWRGVFFHRSAKFVKGAGVFPVLGRNAFGHGLRTFELRAGIEEAALLAAVKFELALGALAVGVEAGGEDGAAVGAARAGDSANHAGGARA